MFSGRTFRLQLGGVVLKGRLIGHYEDNMFSRWYCTYKNIKIKMLVYPETQTHVLT